MKRFYTEGRLNFIVYFKATSIQSYTPTVALTGFFLKFKSNLLVVRVVGSGGWQSLVIQRSVTCGTT
jgi:hypothetical protein